MASRPIIVVEDDRFLRLVQIILDPATPTERLSAFTHFMAHDEPNFKQWCQRLRARLGEIRERLNVVGMADNDTYDFPLTQQELGECLGLTSVHVNRTLQEMRRRELIEVENRRVRILDLAGLKSAGDFDPYYLYLEKLPR